MAENKENIENENTEDIPMAPTGIHRIYDIKPYTIHRVRRILSEHYDCRLENIWQGYKANRRYGYTELYRIVQNSDNKVIVEETSLYALQKIFAKEDFPLYDEKSQCNQTLRNKKAEAFLDIVNNL